VNPLQKAFLKSLLKKILMIPAAWCFFWAIFPLAWHRNIIQYLMISLLNWLGFILFLFYAVGMGLLLDNPNLLKNLIVGKAGKQATAVKPKAKKEKKPKESTEDKVPIY